MQVLGKTWELIWRHKLPLLQLTGLVYGPFYVAYGITVLAGWLPADGADKMFGLVGAFLMPVINGCIVWLAQRWYDNEPATLKQAWDAMPSYWSRLLTTYIAISFVLLGWLIVTVLPAYILMMVLKIDQPIYLLPVALAAAAYAMCRFVFVDPLVVNLGRSPWHARQESTALTVGHRGRIIGAGLLTYTLPFILEIAGEFAASYISPERQNVIAAVSTGTGILAALLYIVPVIYFYVYYRVVTAEGSSSDSPQLGAAAS